MENITAKWLHLKKAIDLNLPAGIHSKLMDVINEDIQYAADEVVELAEEILNHITALGMIYYLQSKKQKEVYNDFLIQLFNSSGHDYNSGPLFRWIANMVRELEDEIPNEHYQFFWKEGALNSEVHHLALLRNEVMHGFFVLPPERNFIEAEEISKLLIKLSESNCFGVKANFHFCNENGFTGNWNISDETDWKSYLLENAFGGLCQRILHENSNSFWTEEAKVHEAQTVDVPELVKDFIMKNNKGALAVYFHPHGGQQLNVYAAIANWLNKQSDFISVAYQLQDQGLTYTGGFLLQRLSNILNSSGKTNAKNKKLEEVVCELRAEHKNKKVVVLINEVHKALFSPQHLTILNNFFYENNILLIGIGQHYEHFDKVFNQSIELSSLSAVPTADESRVALHNYLRFKGPSKERSEERSDVEALENILSHVLDELNSGKELFARRFADDKDFNLEYVLEVFSLLHPWVKTRREAFEADSIDELYGFPNNMTEVTPIYLSLGRRDLKLEYQHKVISL